MSYDGLIHDNCDGLTERIAALEAQNAELLRRLDHQSNSYVAGIDNLTRAREKAEAQNRQLREVMNLALLTIDAFWPSDPPENEHQASEDRAIAKFRQRAREALAATEPKPKSKPAFCGSRIYVGTTGESACEEPLGHPGDHQQGSFKWPATEPKR